MLYPPAAAGLQSGGFHCLDGAQGRLPDHCSSFFSIHALS